MALVVITVKITLTLPLVITSNILLTYLFENFDKFYELHKIQNQIQEFFNVESSNQSNKYET